MNNLNIDSLRTEIAVLQEEVSAQAPGTGKFKIPVLMTNDIASVVSTNNNNILNRRNGNLKSASVTIETTLELHIPTYLTYHSVVDPIPEGTKFIVSFVGGSYNDARIIGVYDNLDEVEEE